MADPPIPPLEHLAERPFSFFPPIVGIEHNEWRLGKATWSEVLIINDRSGQELWVPRRYFGEVSRIEDPVVIVGLALELEYKSGMLRPHHRRVFSIPSPAGPAEGESTISDSGAPKPHLGVRLEKSDTRAIKLLALGVAAFIGLYLLAVNYTRIGNIRQQTAFTMKDQSFLELSARDDHFAVISKLGQPASVHNKEVGTIQYEAMAYPDRKYTVILMGRDVKELAYIGTVDERWRPVHFVDFRSGGSSDALLKTLEKF